MRIETRLTTVTALIFAAAALIAGTLSYRIEIAQQNEIGRGLGLAGADDGRKVTMRVAGEEDGHRFSLNSHPSSRPITRAV